jgi:hypothetical protein
MPKIHGLENQFLVPIMEHGMVLASPQRLFEHKYTVCDEKKRNERANMRDRVRAANPHSK